MTTINDIAKKAQISKTTVSRVLNEDKTLSITVETRDKILKVAEELNYVPKRQRNSGTQIIKPPKKHEKIGLLLYFSQQLEFDDPYFSAIRNGIEKRMYELGIEISKVLRPPFLTKELEGLTGLLVVGTISKVEAVKLAKEVKHIVFVDVSPDEQFYDSVVLDFEKATEQVIKHLYDLGHRKIGYIGGKTYVNDETGKRMIQDIRKKTYEKLLTDWGIYNPNYTYIGNWATRDGFSLMEEAIKSANIPTAFFVGSDPMAIGAINALTTLGGLSVPEDVAIVGFDGIEIGEYVSPPLSTVKVNTEGMGKAAVNLLVERLNGRNFPLKVVVPTSLIIRKSCGGEK